jgi:hypothetical protein
MADMLRRGSPRDRFYAVLVLLSFCFVFVLVLYAIVTTALRQQEILANVDMSMCQLQTATTLGFAGVAVTYERMVTTALLRREGADGSCPDFSRLASDGALISGFSSLLSERGCTSYIQGLRNNATRDELVAAMRVSRTCSDAGLRSVADALAGPGCAACSAVQRTAIDRWLTSAVRDRIAKSRTLVDQRGRCVAALDALFAAEILDFAVVSLSVALAPSYDFQVPATPLSFAIATIELGSVVGALSQGMQTMFLLAETAEVPGNATATAERARAGWVLRAANWDLTSRFLNSANKILAFTTSVTSQALPQLQALGRSLLQLIPATIAASSVVAQSDSVLGLLTMPEYSAVYWQARTGELIQCIKSSSLAMLHSHRQTLTASRALAQRDLGLAVGLACSLVVLGYAMWLVLRREQSKLELLQKDKEVEGNREFARFLSHVSVDAPCLWRALPALCCGSCLSWTPLVHSARPYGRCTFLCLPSLSVFWYRSYLSVCPHGPSSLSATSLQEGRNPCNSALLAAELLEESIREVLAGATATSSPAAALIPHLVQRMTPTAAAAASRARPPWASGDLAVCSVCAGAGSNGLSVATACTHPPPRPSSPLGLETQRGELGWGEAMARPAGGAPALPLDQQITALLPLVATIQSSLQHQRQVFTDALDWEKISSGRLTMELEACALRAQVEEAVRMMVSGPAETLQLGRYWVGGLMMHT